MISRSINSSSMFPSLPLPLTVMVMMMMIMFMLLVTSTLALKKNNATATTTTSSTTDATSSIFTPQEHWNFRRDGYIVVPAGDGRLLDMHQVNNLVRAGESKIRTAPKFPFYYAVSANGAMFEPDAAANANDDAADHPQDAPPPHLAFREAALFSSIPIAVAELMQLDAQTQTLRVLRDIFIAKSVHDDSSCDWHVDDVGFWPQSYLSSSSDENNNDNNEKDQSGINVWIALDDMPAQYQGSMALSPGSHVAPWRHDAYLALGQNRSQDGGITKQQVQQKMQEKRAKAAAAAAAAADSNSNNNSKYPTCEIGFANPELKQTIDATSLVLDIKRGDIILATRNLFHKTVPVTSPEGVDYYSKQMGQEFLKRYSIRYVPGSARLPNGWSVEWSVVQDAANAGRRLDDIAENNNDTDEIDTDHDHQHKMMFYPRVWPRPQDNIHAGLGEMAAAVEDLKQRAQAEFMSTIFATAS